jgi:hypothetical protein
MIDREMPSQKPQQPANAGKEKKPYHKPSFRHERVFETQALSCGKIAATVPTCQFNTKTS